jgi:hypothetical protein
MHSAVRMCLGVTLLAFVAGALGACGQAPEKAAERGMAVFRKLTLKNSSPAKPASAQCTPTSGQPGINVGPVAPGATGTQQTGGVPATGVTVTVNFQGGPTFTGSRDFAPQQVTWVDVDCGEETGTATVYFESGSEPLPLTKSP